MNRPILTLVLSTLLFALAMAAIWMTEMPLGVPGEWLWGRIDWQREDLWDFLLGGLLLVLVGGCYVGIVGKGVSRIEAASNISLTLWLLLLVIAGFTWLIAVQFCPPEGYGIEKNAHVIYFNASSGYFTEARERNESLGEYLANYEEDIKTEDVAKRVLHHGTHPPGLFISFRGLIWLCESSPMLVEWINSTQPTRVRAMFKEIETHLGPGQNLTDSDRAVIWLAAILVQLIGAMVVVPLFFLARSISSPRAAWIASAFWPLVPSVAIFLPKSDVLMAFLGTLFLAVWCSGWRRKSLFRCASAGVLLWLGMMVSLALLPVAFLAFVMVAWDLAFSTKNPNLFVRMRTSLPCLVAGLLGFLFSAGLLSGVTNMNLFAVWWQNYQNHAEFYAHFPRSYGAWLLANPIEASFALGVPICVCCSLGILKHWNERNTGPLDRWGPDVGFLSMLAVLWLSGKNQGEAARLWLVIFPYFVWISARFWDRPLDSEKTTPRSLVVPMLILQMLACWLTVSRIYGFPL